jgi:hypothetical protein
MRINALSLFLSGRNSTSVFADRNSIQSEGTALVDGFQAGMATQFLALQQGDMRKSLSEAREKYANGTYSVVQWVDTARGARYETNTVSGGLWAFGQTYGQSMWRYTRLQEYNGNVSSSSYPTGSVDATAAKPAPGVRAATSDPLTPGLRDYRFVADNGALLLESVAGEEEDVVSGTEASVMSLLWDYILLHASVTLVAGSFLYVTVANKMKAIEWEQCHLFSVFKLVSTKVVFRMAKESIVVQNKKRQRIQVSLVLSLILSVCPETDYRGSRSAAVRGGAGAATGRAWATRTPSTSSRWTG